MNKFAAILEITKASVVLWLTLGPARFVADARDSPKSFEEEANPEVFSYGAEMDFSSGYTWRGLAISDRPVASPAAWISTAGFTFIASNILTLTYEREWNKLKIEPTLETYWYRDPLSIAASKSTEASLKISYPVGPLRVFTAHSVDVWKQKGAYFGEGGIEYNRQFSKKNKLETSLSFGWASSSFNNAYADVNKAAFNVVGLECSFTHYFKKHFYLNPHFEFSSIADHELRASLSHPNLFTFGMAIGVEF